MAPCYATSDATRAHADRHAPPPAAPGQPALGGLDGARDRWGAGGCLGGRSWICAGGGGRHECPFVPGERERAAGVLVYRGLAAALVVSGPATGRATPLADVKRVRDAVPDVPLLVGSGVTAETVAELLSVADGAIVGTAVKRDGDVRNPVDRARVERLVAAARPC